MRTLNMSKGLKDLGVWFTENLSFNDHITNTSLKGMRMLGFVLRNCSEFSIPTINSLYCSLVRSKILNILLWFGLPSIRFLRRN